MKIRAIALQTFRGFLRNKLILLFCAIFLCVLLLFSSPVLMYKSMSKSMSAGQAEGLVLSMISMINSLVSGFGSLLAAYAAADSVSAEVRSGTILAIMARPVRRWEFLLGKFLGVQLLMSVYVAFLVATSYTFASMGGQQINAPFWTLVVYPLVRYTIYIAIGLLLGTVMHPILAFAATVFVAVLAGLLAPSDTVGWLPVWLKDGIYIILPSTDMLSEEKFLALTKASVMKTTWTEHLTALSYGLDYALVLFLLAMWAFRRRSLTRE